MPFRCLARITMLLLLVANAAAEPVPGELAPGFELSDQHGRLHALEDYRQRWVVLYFYPQSGAPECTAEACAFRDAIDEFRRLNTQILGISLDSTERQQAFAEHHRLPFPLLADRDGAVAIAYGVRTHRHGKTVARRQTFLISPTGKLVKHYTDVAVEEHTREVLADLEALLRAERPGPED